MFCFTARIMRNIPFRSYDNKGTDQLCGKRVPDQSLVFATYNAQYLYFLNTKLQASSYLAALFQFLSETLKTGFS